jgi:hypothetical protein
VRVRRVFVRESVCDESELVKVGVCVFVRMREMEIFVEVGE